MYFYDEKSPGLELVVTPHGKKVFYSRVWISKEKRSVRVKIGNFPQIMMQQARRQNKVNVAQAYQGINLVEEKKKARKETTLGELYALLNENEISHLRPATQDTYRRVYSKHLGPWSGRMLSSICRADVLMLRNRIGQASGKYVANTTLRLLRRMMNLARDYVAFSGQNPVTGVQMFREEQIKRRLEDSELKRLVEAIEQEENELARDILKVLLYSGARVGNVLSMKWEDVDLTSGMWTVPQRSSKSHESIEVFLSSPVLRILKQRYEARDGSEWIFPAESEAGHSRTVQKAKDRALERAEIKKRFRLHDFRHNFGSMLNDAKVDPILIKESLGHKDFQSTLRYVHVHRDRRRAAVESVSNAIKVAVEGEGNGEELAQ